MKILEIYSKIIFKNIEKKKFKSSFHSLKMTFHQKNSSYIARKIHDFRSLRYQSFFFFFLPICKDFFNRLYVHLYLHSQTEHISFVWRIKKWKKKKDAYRFKKCITHSTRGHCVPRHVTRTEKSRTSTDVAKKKKRKKRKKVDINEWPQVGFLTYAVRDPPETGFLHLLVRRGASLSSFRNSWANNSTENTHAGMCETR